MQLQLNGNATVMKSKNLTDEQKASALATEDGKVKAIRIPLVDSEGNDVTLTGTMYLSKAGSLTCRFNLKVKNFEVVEVADPKLKSQDQATDVSQLLNDLGV